MTPPPMLADDWLYWDPCAIDSYPHSPEAPDEPPEQLELFEPAAKDRCGRAAACERGVVGGRRGARRRPASGP